MVLVSISKALAASILLGLILSSFGPTTVISYVVTDIDSSTVLDLGFDQAGSKTVNISVPQPFKSVSAKMNLSGAPTVPGGNLYPSNVSVDVGSDGKRDWAFNGTGYGPLGRQDRFSDGSTMKELTVVTSSNKTTELFIPKGATITSAGMTVTGVPTATEHFSGFYPNETLDKSADRNYTIQGIEPEDIAINSSIALKDVVILQNKVDVNQSRRTTSFIFLSNYQTAQSFKLNRTDPRQKTVRLSSVEVYFSATSTSGLHANLYIYNSSQAQNYRPTGQVMGLTASGESQLVGNYFNFTFGFPIELEPDRVYTMLLGQMITGGTLPAAHYHKASSGTNANSAYPLDGCFMQTTTDDGTTWTPDYLSDWTFRVHTEIARPIANSEATGILANGQPPSQTGGSTLYFNQTPRYNSSGWNFNLTNSLSMSTLYNLSAGLDCNDAPDHVVLDVGNDSVPELSFNGNLSGPLVVSSLEDKISSVVATAVGQSKGSTDTFGNHMVPVLVRISSFGRGHLRLTNLSIVYNYTISLPGFMEAIVSYQSLHGQQGPGPLKVPIKVSSSTPGRICLSDLEMIYDGPPKQVLAVPSGLTLPEEGVNFSMLDLSCMFQDDFDANLDLAIQNITATPGLNKTLNITIDQSGHLSVDATKAVNWSGLLSVLVNATDGSNFTEILGPINISVTNVNDAPVISSTSPKNVSLGSMYRYNFTLVDSDSSTLTVWLEKAPLAMDLNRINQSLTWTPGVSDIGKHNFVLKVSDGTLETQQNLSITVRTSGGGGTNDAPQVQAISNQTTGIGDNFTVKVLADDPDTDTIFFTLVKGPANMTVNGTTGLVTWRPDKVGRYNATVRVSDGELYTDLSFNITVVEQSTEKPTITIERPLSGEKVSGVLIILGKASSKGSSLVKVEYSIDGGQWFSADLETDGSWSAEASSKNLSKGNHTLVIRATNSRGLTGQTYTTFVLKGRPTSRPGSAFMALLPYLLILMILIVVLVLAVALAKKRSKSSSSSKTGGSKTKTDTKSKGAKADTSPVQRSNVDSAFLVYHDGRLITYASRSEIADLDATLQVIKDFVKASFRGDVGRLDALKYENMNIILERGVQMYLVVITPEGEDLALQNLRRKMRSFLGDVHERYKHILKVWDGKYKSVKPIEKMVENYVKGTGAPHDEKITSDGTKEDPPEEDEAKHAVDREEKDPKRWDESPDLDDKGLSNIEKQKLLQDKLTRGEISEMEFERLSEKLK